MSWAARRRFFILLLIGLVVLAAVAVTAIATLYHTPSCVDNIQNQGEEGVDCGGPCSYLCTALETPPTVLFTKAIANGSGRTDVLAYVENKNAGAAARGARYRISLYAADQSLIQLVTGSIDLPPSTVVPVYVPGVVSGNQPVASAFLSIDPASTQWYSYTEARTLPRYDNDAVLVNAGAAPRITASLSNDSATPERNIRAIVTVRDASGTVLAASQTVLATIPGQGSAKATFTWNQPFSGVPASIEVIPVIPLP